MLKQLPFTPIETTDEIKVELVQSMGGDQMVVAAARVSTVGEGALALGPELMPTLEAQTLKNSAEFGLINYLMRHRHGTPFEHGSLTFFVHAPIFVWREWHRHRVGFSYNEESARYKQLKPLFWLPKRERKLVPIEGFKPARPQFEEANNAQFHEFCELLKTSYEQSYSIYQYLLTQGFAREAARAVLPVGIYSACWVTCNPRSLMHFLSLRTHEESAAFISYPQAEIEQAARAAELLFRKGWPLTYAAFVANRRVAP